MSSQSDEELLLPADIDFVARIAGEVGVAATTSLDGGCVVINFGARRVSFLTLRTAVDPVGMMRCMLGVQGVTSPESKPAT